MRTDGSISVPALPGFKDILTDRSSVSDLPCSRTCALTGVFLFLLCHAHRHTRRQEYFLSLTRTEIRTSVTQYVSEYGCDPGRAGTEIRTSVTDILADRSIYLFLLCWFTDILADMSMSDLVLVGSHTEAFLFLLCLVQSYSLTYRVTEVRIFVLFVGIPGDRGTYSVPALPGSVILTDIPGDRGTYFCPVRWHTG